MKIKRRKRNSGKSRFALRRQIRRKTYNLTKIEQCGKIIQEKTCEICGKKQEDPDMLLCDQCDDAYHCKCLQLPSVPSLTQIWICPNCVNRKKKINQQASQKKQQICFKCQKKVDQIPQLRYMCEGQLKQMDILQHRLVQCLACKQHFHPFCFSKRNKSINCWDCQIKIRREGPKSHEQFLRFLKKQQQIVHQIGYLQLKGKSDSQQEKQQKSLYMGLRIFQQLTNWQLITRYQASLYYALKSRKLTFCDQQLYSSPQMMQLNDSKKQIIRARSLNPQDQKVYQFFKAKIRKGAVGPFQIREDRTLGFYIVALAHIQKGTIICQYVGEVSSHRESLSEKNDSIFTLLIAGSSKDDLNIIPRKFGNISRFICGVNNYDKDHLRKVNIRSVRFQYKGRIRIIFVAKKNIEKDDILYLNYNAGTYQEYPTADFV